MLILIQKQYYLKLNSKIRNHLLVKYWIIMTKQNCGKNILELLIFK